VLGKSKKRKRMRARFGWKGIFCEAQVKMTNHARMHGGNIPSNEEVD